MSKNQTVTESKIKTLVERQSALKRLPNATLFHGPNKRILLHLLIELAETVNQTTIERDEMQSDTLLEPAEEVIVINPPKSIKIEHIKALQDRIKYGPTNQAYCIAIIHNIQRLTNSAANALLKSIEEPPTNTIFFLSTQNKFNVPKTIISRSQLFHVPESSDEQAIELANLIEKINQKITYSPPETFLAQSPFEQTIYIQNLPYDTELLTDLLQAWKLNLYSKWPNLEKKEHIFLEKIIEIISNIKYNFNLKLQLLAVTLQTEEDDLQ